MSKPSANEADLRLENTMLTNELRHLRAELVKSRQQLRKARSEVKELRAAAGAPAREVMTPKARRARKLEAQALDDMHWLVNRIDRSPIGPLLRRREGFRTLKQRYAADPRA